VSERSPLIADPVPPAPPPTPPSVRGGRRRRRWPIVLATVVLAIAAVIVTAMAFIKVPYVIISPGTATPLERGIVSIPDARTYPHRGDLLYLTVRVSNSDPNVWRWVFAKLDGDVSVEKREDVIGCASYTDSGHLQDELMQQSQDVAKEVSLTRLGYDVPQVATSALILDVQCDGPSQDHLRPGDRITAVDGTPVDTAEAVGPLVKAHAPGDRLRLSVERDGKALDVTVRLGRHDGAGYLGIVSQTLSDWKFPVDVKIDTQRVSGPSAGLAFTLAIIDQLTPGSLTGGQKVAVTGSIEADGSVGAVGGVAQKAVAAREAGAHLMLVPVGEVADARAHAGDMRVIPVRTIDDALRALAKAGGAPVATATTTTPSPVPSG
jgi:PDZ domain-containing protein